MAEASWQQVDTDNSTMRMHVSKASVVLLRRQYKKAIVVLLMRPRTTMAKHRITMSLPRTGALIDGEIGVDGYELHSDRPE